VTPAATGLLGVTFFALIAWRLYRRARRLIGRQRSRLWRHYAAVTLLPLVLLLLGLASFGHPAALAAWAAGLVAGISLAVWGLRLTKFERSEGEWYYTPNAHIGIALTVLLVARIVWRLAETGMWRLAMAGPSSMQAPPPGDMFRSPLTLLIFGTLLAYYAAYGAGLLRWRRSVP
jgi:hypothetical protein